MKITGITDLHTAPGFGQCSFLKITTDEGIVGWAEFNETHKGRPQSAIIRAIGEQLIGTDPLAVQKVATNLYQLSIQAPGGMFQRANAAIEMALWDIRAKSLGVPVYALFGGPVRERVEVYWSHCASYRVQADPRLGIPAIRTLDDVRRLGDEVRSRGFKGLKANCFNLVDGELTRMMQGNRALPSSAALNLERSTYDGIVETMRAFREGAGPDMKLMIDANFNFKVDAYIRIARGLEPLDLSWLELDMWDAQGLADIRSKSPVPIASLEGVIGRRAYRPFLERNCVDVAIVDPLWNGWSEALKIAAMIESFDLSCAPHNYHGHLSTAISAHFCAVVPNIRVLEVDIDGVPWRDELFHGEVKYENGEMIVPTGPGWGMDVNEAAVAKYAA